MIIMLKTLTSAKVSFLSLAAYCRENRDIVIMIKFRKAICMATGGARLMSFVCSSVLLAFCSSVLLLWVCIVRLEIIRLVSDTNCRVFQPTEV